MEDPVLALTEDFVMTVSGPIPGAAVGFTLPHEHLYIQFWERVGRYDYAHQLPDADVLAEELGAFRDAGGSCLVDLTLPGVGRQPELIKELSERTGVQVVMGCGWYREPYYPAEHLIDRRSVDDLARQLIGEINDGVQPSGIRPGIIGEIGADKSWISAQEERVHRAAARAHRASGLAISTHAVYSDVGLAQLKIFDEEGADLSRVVIGHADTHPFLGYHMEIVRRGALVQYDQIGTSINAGQPRLLDRTIRNVLDLVDRGYASQLLLSHDVCEHPHLRYFGGPGYSYLQSVFLPMLEEAGLDRATIRQVTVDNPRRILGRRMETTVSTRGSNGA
jgi:predicted metal-dependent phosphotriesterase family hydrolase